MPTVSHYGVSGYQAVVAEPDIQAIIRIVAEVVILEYATVSIVGVKTDYEARASIIQHKSYR